MFGKNIKNISAKRLILYIYHMKSKYYTEFCPYPLYQPLKTGDLDYSTMHASKDFD